MVTYSLWRFFRLISSMPISVITRWGSMVSVWLSASWFFTMKRTVSAEMPRRLRHFGFVGADEHLQHVFLEAIGIAGFFAFERRQKIVAIMAMRSSDERRLDSRRKPAAPGCRGRGRRGFCQGQDWLRGVPAPRYGNEDSDRYQARSKKLRCHEPRGDDDSR